MIGVVEQLHNCNDLATNVVPACQRYAKNGGSNEDQEANCKFAASKVTAEGIDEAIKVDVGSALNLLLQRENNHKLQKCRQ